ncbi:MAG: hypothetical protein ACRC33_02835 [Gemmataceae bacterium]
MRMIIPLTLFLAGCASTHAGPRVRPGEDPHQRAGHPAEVSARARPSDDGGYVMYPVGGGASAGHGDGPTRDQGTWGWDYVGCRLPSWVTLGWWNGKPQGGTGAYATDGPRPLERIERRHE